MAWIPMYLLHEDVCLLNDWLNREEAIAFLVANGPRQWIAKKTHTLIPDAGNHQTARKPRPSESPFVECSLWHIPSGPLPLPKERSGGVRLRFTADDWKEDTIPDPWAGWTEIRMGANLFVPYFGVGHPGIIDMKIELPYNGVIRLSNFGWIGNHYREIGSPANPLTEKFWNRLRRMVKRVSVHIPRENHPDGKNEIYAFPAAYAAISKGSPCASNS